MSPDVELQAATTAAVAAIVSHHDSSLILKVTHSKPGIEKSFKSPPDFRLDITKDKLPISIV
ncbi:MAG: hypothetical protein LBD88_01870 [Candidatus Peribacteria bacterium]|jgi:hypothetical protein|nr:hypothetical protein [Candidatus Peribacteria bacterium]